MTVLRSYSLLLVLAASPVICQQATVPAPAAGDAQGQPVIVQEGPMHIGGPVRPPSIIHSVEPAYTEDARREMISGNVQVYLWVDKNGNPSHVKVVRGIGHGLDERAVEAVRQYKFKPATRDGQPVTVDLYIDVNFQIYDGTHPPRP